MVHRKQVSVHRAATVTQAAPSVNGKSAQFQRDIRRKDLVDLLHALALDA
jgi:hypothetical protein